MAYCFISDLHLHEGRQDLKRAFFSFLEEKVTKADKLYILGDLFETWIGDDDNSPFVAEVIDALQKANDSTDIFFMHGNRDFLLGKDFSSLTGMQIITDPSYEKMFNQPVLLMHGDLLCVDDVDYLEFRNTSRTPQWKDDFLSKSLSERKEIAQNLREISKQATGKKREEIMDVSQEEVIKVIKEHSVSLLIHGHTHRPNTHEIATDNLSAKRIVLGDWDKYGWYIWMDSNSCELRKFSIF